MLSWLYNIFPRQIGFPSRITVTSADEFMNYVNKYNGKVRIYGSVYNYVPGEEHKIKLDKVFFDFDGEQAYEHTRRLIDYLHSNDYLFTCFFSGGGYHVYLFLDTDYRVINRKDCLTNIQKFFEKECNITIDPAVIGDLARIATVPNTYNLKRKKFCIPVRMDDMDMSHEDIAYIAEFQHMDGVVYGNVKFDPKLFDYPTEHSFYSTEENYVLNNDELIVNDDIFTLNLHPCIFNMLALGHSNHIGFRGRFHIITYLRDIGILYGDTKRIIKQHLTNIHDGIPEYKHCYNKKQVEKIYKNDKYGFVKCETLKNEGYCPGKCGRITNYGNYTKADIYM